MNAHARTEEITQRISGAEPPAIVPLLLADRLFRDYPTPRPEIARLCEFMVNTRFHHWTSVYLQQSLATLVLQTHLARAQAFLIADVGLRVHHNNECFEFTFCQPFDHAPVGPLASGAPDPASAPLLHLMHVAARLALSDLLWPDFGQPAVACWIANCAPASDRDSLSGIWVIGYEAAEFRAFTAPAISGKLRRKLILNPKALADRMEQLLDGSPAGASDAH